MRGPLSLETDAETVVQVAALLAGGVVALAEPGYAGVGDPIGLSAVAAPVPVIEVCLHDSGPRAAALAAWLAPLFVLDRVGPQGEILAKPGTEVLSRLRLPLARDQTDVE